MQTIKDIAEKAGVSFSTVSKVLNNYPDVGAKTKEKVLRVIEENKFIPNSSARKLAQKSSTTLGVIISGLEEILPGDISTLQILQGVLEAAKGTDYDIVFYPLTVHRQKQKTFQQFCRENNIGGAVISGLQTDDPYFRQVASSSLPCVTIDFKLPGRNHSALSVDNISASKAATEFLIEQGHHCIGAICGKENSVVGQERFAGYRQALAENGLPYQPEFCGDGSFNDEIAYSVTCKILKDHPEVTALVCASDIMAVAAYRAADKLGRKVGKDLAVIGFDDLPIATYVTPKLTTIQQDFFAFGQEATVLLQEILLAEKPARGQVFIPYTLLERESTFVLGK